VKEFVIVVKNFAAAGIVKSLFHKPIYEPCLLVTQIAQLFAEFCEAGA